MSSNLFSLNMDAMVYVLTYKLIPHWAVSSVTMDLILLSNIPRKIPSIYQFYSCLPYLHEQRLNVVKRMYTQAHINTCMSVALKFINTPPPPRRPISWDLSIVYQFFYFLSSSLIFILMILNFHYALQAP